MLDEAGKAILTEGGIWAALWMFTVTGLGLAIIHLQKKLYTCQGDLVAATKAFGEIVSTNSMVMQQNTAENAKRTAANEAMAHTLELLTSQLTMRIDSMSAQITEGLREVRETRSLVSQLPPAGRRA